MIKIQLANLCVALENKYDFIEKLARDYITDGEPEFTVFATDEEIAEEGKNEEGSFSLGYLESIVLYRKIAEKLPEYDAFVFHGAVIEFEGRAYLFTAKSGVGKTTHIRLWQKKFGNAVSILNGDKPVLRIIDGKAYASGTPWRGKEGYGKPGLLELYGIAFLERALENEAYPVMPDAVIMKFATQAYIPKTEAAVKTLSLFNKILSTVPLITLKCNMNLDAADVAKAAFCKAQLN